MDHTKRLLLQEWQETSAIAIDGFFNKGLAERLWESCMKIYGRILSALEQENLVSPIVQARIRRDKKLLFLWGHGFQSPDGDLDLLLRLPKRLQHGTMGLLASTGAKLICLTSLAIKSTETSDAMLLDAHMRTLLAEARRSLAESQDYSEVDSSSDESDDELEDIVEDLTTCVQCLIDLGPSLEYPAEDYWSHREIVQEASEDSQAGYYYFASMIEHRFARAASPLVERLGKLNWNRFVRLRMLRESTARDNTVQHIRSHQGDGFVDTPSTIVSSRGFKDSGLGTSLPNLQAVRHANSKASFASSVNHNRHRKIPPLSIGAKQGLPFECGACGQTIIVKTQTSWEEHLYRDLQPYTCFLEDCSFKITTSHNHEPLIKHLESAHPSVSETPQTCVFCFGTIYIKTGCVPTHYLRHMEEISLAALPYMTNFDAESDEAKSNSISDNVDSEQSFFEEQRLELKVRSIDAEPTAPCDIAEPTPDRFKAQICQLNPRMQAPFLINRIAVSSIYEASRLTIQPQTSGFDVKVSALAEDVKRGNKFPLGMHLPPVKRLPSEFECNICDKVQRIYKSLDWIKHVHEDVQPYTCTFPDCSSPKSFKRRADWIRHENERHRKLERWACNVPDCGHTCYRKDNFVQHLVREHKFSASKADFSHAKSKTPSREVDDDLLATITQCSHDTTAQPEDEPCRFCGKVSSTWRKLTLHLAKHMEDIAMPMLKMIGGSEIRLAAEAADSRAAKTNTS